MKRILMVLGLAGVVLSLGRCSSLERSTASSDESEFYKPKSGEVRSNY